MLIRIFAEREAVLAMRRPYGNVPAKKCKSFVQRTGFLDPTDSSVSQVRPDRVWANRQLLRRSAQPVSGLGAASARDDGLQIGFLAGKETYFGGE